LLRRSGLLDEASAQLLAAAAAEPRDAVFQFGLGFCHEKQGCLDGAIIAYERAIEECPGSRMLGSDWRPSLC
jgi:tetratricopeptide (TPR) repeat protein